ncbi:hypothetical protein COOONC_06160 [Cooperia oncophora]
MELLTINQVTMMTQAHLKSGGTKEKNICGEQPSKYGYGRHRKPIPVPVPVPSPVPVPVPSPVPIPVPSPYPFTNPFGMPPPPYPITNPFGVPPWYGRFRAARSGGESISN